MFIIKQNNIPLTLFFTAEKKSITNRFTERSNQGLEKKKDLLRKER